MKTDNTLACASSLYSVQLETLIRPVSCGAATASSPGSDWRAPASQSQPRVCVATNSSPSRALSVPSEKTHSREGRCEPKRAIGPTCDFFPLPGLLAELVFRPSREIAEQMKCFTRGRVAWMKVRGRYLGLRQNSLKLVWLTPDYLPSLLRCGSCAVRYRFKDVADPATRFDSRQIPV